jgi:hypothetical protein
MVEVMVQQNPDMKQLTKKQQQTLVEIVTEQSCLNLGFDDFTDRMLERKLPKLIVYLAGYQWPQCATKLTVIQDS